MQLSHADNLTALQRYCGVPICKAMGVFLLASALSLALLAQPADRARTEALAQRATDRLQALQKEADRLAADERTLLGDLRKLEVDRQIKAEELRQLAADSAQISGELAANRQRMHDLEQQEAASRPELRARLVDIYKMGQGRYLRLLLSTADIRQVGQASRILAALAKLDADRVATRQRTLAELKRTRAALEQRSRRLGTLTAEAERAQAALGRAAESRNALIRDIDNRRDLNAQLVGELQAAQQKLQATLRDLSAGASAAEPAALPLRPFRGDLDWPVAGTLARRPSRQAAPRRPTGSRSAPRRARRCPPSTTVSWPLPTRLAASATWSSSTTAPRASACTGICSRCRSRKGARHRARPGHRNGRAGAGRAVRALLRAAHRRSVGRSLTMAEETVGP